MLILGGLSLGLAVGMVWGRSPGLVEWCRARAVCIESDDWGLCGFLPDSSAIAAMDREALAPGHFPDVYWHSTLEDSAMVAELAAVLKAHVGRDGLPAVMQPNYILASLAYGAGGDDSTMGWREHILPDVPPGYERPGLWDAVLAARLDGVWHPELHGRWHYDPRRRMDRTRGVAAVEMAASAQILIFPDSERAWELGPWRAREDVEREFDGNLSAFSNLFGGPPQSIIAPDYVWDDHHEDMWCRRDLRTIQGQRQQRKASWRGMQGRIRKVLHRTFTRWWRRDRSYLDRNCLFEPVQQHDAHAITEAALKGVREAWERGEPAVLEAHRINFAHLEQEVPELGRKELGVLLQSLDDDRPLYLVDHEVTQLQRHGTSWAVRGTRLVLRNHTHSRRLLVVPVEALNLANHLQGRNIQSSQPLIASLAPGETRVIAASDAISSELNPN